MNLRSLLFCFDIEFKKSSLTLTAITKDGQYVLDHMKGDEFADFDMVNPDFRVIQSEASLIPSTNVTSS